MMYVGRETRRATVQSPLDYLPATTCGVVNRGNVQWGLGLPAEEPSCGEVLRLNAR